MEKKDIDLEKAVSRVFLISIDKRLISRWKPKIVFSLDDIEEECDDGEINK